MKINSINFISNYNRVPQAKRVSVNFGQKKQQHVQNRPDLHYFDMVPWIQTNMQSYSTKLKALKEHRSEFLSDDEGYERLSEDIILFDDLLKSADNLLQEPDDISDKADDNKINSMLAIKGTKEKIENDKLIERVFETDMTAQKYFADFDPYTIVRDFRQHNSILLYSPDGGQKEVVESILRESPSTNIVNIGSVREEELPGIILKRANMAKDYYDKTRNHSVIYVSNCERFLYKNSCCIKQFQDIANNCSRKYHCTIILGADNPELIDPALLNKRFITSRLYISQGDMEKRKSEAIELMQKTSVDKKTQDEIIKRYFSNNNETISLDALNTAIIETKNQISDKQLETKYYLVETEKRKYVPDEQKQNEYRDNLEKMLSSYGI